MPPSQQRKGAAASASNADKAATAALDTSSTTSPAPTLSTSIATDPLPTVRVNKANLAEIKTALDDIVRKHLTDQAFTPSRLHPTVHLSLGYASVILALGASAYCYFLPFEESKTVLWIAVIGYGALQSLLWAWKRWVEKGEVFRGRRRRIVKRIETDLIQIYSSTSVVGPIESVLSVSPNSRPSSPISATTPIASPLTSPSSLSPSSSGSQLSSVANSSSGPDPRGPSYTVRLTLSTTSNNGKSLIHKARVVSGKHVGEVIDEDGGVEEGEVARWISGLLDDAGLVDVEDEGLKQE
ncbi:putative signal peptidase complex subunit 2 [Vanrija pseudolonga]|uniref:Signal peptidase complex subunit 2 n=1 Tax=Vanrija pseudolonga TaxID=143232 RepID=A0AAF1BMS4_9TREE|nr:putative signal peptidase complex subunit 2 [Vanrija pseudolonga]